MKVRARASFGDKEPGRGAPPSVLLIDDDPIQLKLGHVRLTLAGFLVDTASSAEEALERCQGRRPDAILSDVLMRDMDGFGLCRHIKERPELASIPIVLHSSYFEGDPSRNLAVRLGACALVPRSGSYEAAIAALREWLSAAKKVREALDA